jgi:hypothetical protein
MRKPRRRERNMALCKLQHSKSNNGSLEATSLCRPAFFKDHHPAGAMLYPAWHPSTSIYPAVRFDIRDATRLGAILPLVRWSTVRGALHLQVWVPAVPGTLPCVCSRRAINPVRCLSGERHRRRESFSAPTDWHRRGNDNQDRLVVADSMSGAREPPCKPRLAWIRPELTFRIPAGQLALVAGGLRAGLHSSVNSAS